MGLLARAIHSGIKQSLESQISRVWQLVSEMAPEVVEANSWEDWPPAQEVFIEPESVHAYMKLQAQIALFCTTTYFKNPQFVSVSYIRYYLEYLCKYYGIDHESIFN